MLLLGSSGLKAQTIPNPSFETDVYGAFPGLCPQEMAG